MTDFLFDREVSVEFINRDDPSDVVTVDDPGIIGREPLKITFQVEKQVSTEPNRAFIEIWNLADDTAARINFRKPLLEFRFGRKVNLFAGYREQSKKIFSGVVISAITRGEPPLKVTRIECRNIFYELMQLPIQRTFTKGDQKSHAILNILKDIGATVEGAAKGVLRTRLAGQVFKDTVKFEGSAYNVIDKINRGALGTINVYFDDIGTSFNPVGVASDDPVIIYDAEEGQLIGVPEPTEIGADFKVLLNNELKISQLVVLISNAIESFFSNGHFVVKQVIHNGSNRADGPFESRVSSIFDRTNQAGP